MRVSSILKELILTLSISFTVSSDIQDHDSCPLPKSNKASSCRVFHEQERSVIIHDSRGRLGNQMFAYWLLYALKAQFGYQTFIMRRTHEHLHPYFYGLDMEIAEDTLCGFEEMYSIFWNSIREHRMQVIQDIISKRLGYKVPLERDDRGRWKLPQEIIDNPNIDHERIIHSEEFGTLGKVHIPPSSFPWEILSTNTSVQALANPKFHYGRAFIFHPENMQISFEDSELLNQGSNVVQSLERAFEVRSKFTKAATEFMAKAVKQREKSLKPSKKVRSFTFVGIHSRRTDHISLEAERGYPTLKPSYFLLAMDFFRERFKHIIFFYVSDDYKWGKDNLLPRNRKRDLFFGEDGIPDSLDSVGFDLALMSLCNHTIISHGTFSYWVGFLGNGSVITPNHFSQFRVNRDVPNIYRKHPLDHPLPRLFPYL